MLTITKLFEFEAAHFLPNHKGKCKEVHGHSYKLEVEVAAGNGDYCYLDDNDMIMDFGDLKAIVNEYIEEKLDHKFLNDSILKTPTAENMTMIIAAFLNENLPAPFKVMRVRLWETSTSYAEWRRNEN